MYTVPIDPKHVNIFEIVLALLFVRGVFFGVANDCLNKYMREFEKVVSVLHHRVRADLPENFRALNLDDLNS